MTARQLLELLKTMPEELLDARIWCAAPEGRYPHNEVRVWKADRLDQGEPVLVFGNALIFDKYYPIADLSLCWVG